MTDQRQKLEMIRSIETLQLPTEFVAALDNAQAANGVIDAIESLYALAEQWN